MNANRNGMNALFGSVLALLFLLGAAPFGIAGPAVVMGPVAPAPLAGQTCQGMVSVELDDQGLPTGDATNNCENECDAGCQSFLFTIPQLGGQSAAGCGCSDSGMNTCCQAVLTPASSAGGGVGWGKCGVAGCPAGVKCVGILDTKTGETEGECRKAQDQSPQPL